MSFAIIRNKIKELLEMVVGIGEVHDYRRHAAFWAKYYELARNDTEQTLINWEITRAAIDDQSAAIGSSEANEPTFHRGYDTVIMGHMAVCDEDASEKTFQDLIDAIYDVFEDHSDLDCLVVEPETPQTPAIGHATFGGILVHFAEIHFRAVERVQAT